jgi:pimeloyl-ACP methyl ester carboxylesterase
MIAASPTFFREVPRGLTFVQTGSFNTRFVAFDDGAQTRHLPPVVLIHGAFESVETWKPVAKLLARRTHVEAYDLSGYGYTNRVGPYTLAGLVNQLHEFLNARHLEHPVLVGHSLGAGVIARFVLRFPKVASAIVFVDGDGLAVSYPGSGLGDWFPEPYRTAFYRSFVTNSWLMRGIFAGACGPHCPPLSDAQLADLERPFRLHGAEAALFAYGKRRVVGVTEAERERIRGLGINALVIAGAADTVVPPGAARETAAALGAPAPVLIAQRGHLALWSAPRAVAMSIEEFVARLGTGKVGQRSH